jgi:hypothetical protein
MKKIIISLLALAIIHTASADTVYITGCTQPSGTGINSDGSYTELIPFSGGTTAFSTAVGSPARTASRYGAFSKFTNGLPFVRVTPTLGVPGGVYQVHYTHSSTANNTITNAIIGFTNAVGCTLSFTQSDAFQRKNGQPAPQNWIFLGKITNDPGVTVPAFELFVKTTNDTTTLRLLFDCMRFTLDQPCLNVSPVGVTGPLATNLPTVNVTAVDANATKITVYQDNGSGMVEIGSKTAGIIGGTESVPVTGLVQGAQVAATQTVAGQEGCVPAAGTIVGGGANPSFHLALSVRQSSVLGPVGANGTAVGSIIHFLGASSVSGGAPLDSIVISPSNDWQTVTFDRGTVLVGNSSNTIGAAVDGAGYLPNDSVSIRVFAFKTDPGTGLPIYSRIGAQSANVSSNGGFDINWTWNAVSDAEGYRLLRSSTNNSSYTNAFVDVFADNFLDSNNAWSLGNSVLPPNGQTNPSIQWNPSVGSPNTLTNEWYILESLAISIDDPQNTGPFDFYIDNIQNGTNVFQTFENAVAGRTGYVFQIPSTSGTTSGNILPTPNQGAVSNDASDGGTKSFRVQFQWNGTTATKWLRLTTSGAGNPVINLDQPVSLRLLVLPVGAPAPTPPPAPSLSVRHSGSDVILDWEGGHHLLEATEVTGPYTTNAATLAPFTNAAPADAQRFYRLKD